MYENLDEREAFIKAQEDIIAELAELCMLNIRKDEYGKQLDRIYIHIRSLRFKDLM